MLDWIDLVARLPRCRPEFRADPSAVMQSPQLQASLIEFRRKAPQIELAIVERLRTRLATALRNGSLEHWGRQHARAERILPCAGIIRWRRVKSLIGLTYANLDSIRPKPRTRRYLGVQACFSRRVIQGFERHDIRRGAIKSLSCQPDVGANLSGLVYRVLRDGAWPSRLDDSARWRADNEISAPLW